MCLMRGLIGGAIELFIAVHQSKYAKNVGIAEEEGGLVENEKVVAEIV